MSRQKRFKRFLSHYQHDEPRGAAPPRPPEGFVATGFDELMAEWAGCTFERGLYRLHTFESAATGHRWAAEVFPEFAHRVFCFAYNWLGDQYALDLARKGKHGENLVLLLEPGTGEGLEIPASFEAFHDRELVDEADSAVGSSFFQRWAAAHPDSLPLAPDVCVGYKVPLFLGGADELENLEVIDLDVYWTITGQLRRQVEQI